MPHPKITEDIFGYGHANVQATHHATIEFTKDTHLSRNGDCILAISVDRGLADLAPDFKAALKQSHAKLTVRIEVGDICEEIHARGSTQLILSHAKEIVIRKSDYVSDRTLAVRADKAAKDLSRELVEKLKNPKQLAKITLTVQS